MPTSPILSFFFFFFNVTATTEIYTLSLHYALPIFVVLFAGIGMHQVIRLEKYELRAHEVTLLRGGRSEEHTSELQSLRHLVCRLLLEKKKSPRLSSSKCSGLSMVADTVVMR